MRILFLTKSKPYTCEILRALYEAGHEVIVVCKTKESFSNAEMELWCKENNILVCDNDAAYEKIADGSLGKVDLAISNTYERSIKKVLIDYVQGNIFNVHGTPLPQYRGMFVYNWGFFNGEREWCVKAHYDNEEFDNGEIIRQEWFPIDLNQITVKELENESQEVAARLVLDLVKQYESFGKWHSQPQAGQGNYYSRKDFEELKRVDEKDTSEIIRRKIKACWCPPYEGAYWEHDGVRFVLQMPIFLGGCSQ